MKISDLDQKAFEAWFGACDPQVIRWSHAYAGWVAAIAHARAAGEAEPVAVPAGFVLVPVEPTPGMLGAWYRYKSGYHAPGEPKPADTSDYGAYAAMLAAAPVSPAADSGDDDAEHCIACDEPFKDGDLIYPDINGGYIHDDCADDGGFIGDRPDPKVWPLASHTPAPQPGGAVKVKARPLDLATMLKHAWIAGKTGTAWEDYDPTELIVYQRLAEMLDIPLPTPPAGEG